MKVGTKPFHDIVFIMTIIRMLLRKSCRVRIHARGLYPLGVLSFVSELKIDVLYVRKYVCLDLIYYAKQTTQIERE